MPTSSGISVGPDGVARCWWADSDDLYRRYHDLEWGRPVAGDRALFEMLSLEGFQAGLSWLTVLRKRENFRAAFRAFEPTAVARFSSRDIARLMNDVGIIRNRAKIEATVNNARRLRDLVQEFGSFTAYVWRFEPKPRLRLLSRSELLKIVSSREAVAMSKDLRKRGWGFVGPTTVYSFIQAVGLVDDHVRGCAAAFEVERARRAFVRPTNLLPDSSEGGTAGSRHPRRDPLTSAQTLSPTDFDRPTFVPPRYARGPVE